MRKRTLGVVLMAGLAVSAAGASTASNDLDALGETNANVAGYGAATVTGAVVTAVDYVQDTANASLIDSIKFVATGDLVGKDASVRLLESGTSVGNYSCVGSSANGVTLLGVALASGDTVFTCSTPDEPIADFSTLGITVNN